MSSESEFNKSDEHKSVETGEDISKELSGNSSYEMAVGEADSADTSQLDGDTGPAVEEDDSTFGIDLGENTAEDISEELAALPEGDSSQSSLLATEVDPEEDPDFDPLDDSASLDQMSSVMDGAEEEETSALDDDLDSDSSMQLDAESGEINLDSDPNFDATESDELEAAHQSHEGSLDEGFKAAMQEPTKMDKSLSYASGIQSKLSTEERSAPTMEEKKYEASGKPNKMVAAVAGIAVALGLTGYGYSVNSSMAELRKQNEAYAAAEIQYKAQIEEIQNINPAAKKYVGMQSELASFREKYNTVLASSKDMEKQLETYKKSSVNHSALNQQLNEQAEKLKGNVKLINDLKKKTESLEKKVKEYEAKGTLDVKNKKEYDALKTQYASAKKRIEELEKDMTGKGKGDKVLRESLEQVRKKNVQLEERAEVAQKYTKGLEVHLGYVHNKLGMPELEKNTLLSGVSDKVKKQYETVFGKLKSQGTGSGDDNSAYKKKFDDLKKQYEASQTSLEQKQKQYENILAKAVKVKKELDQVKAAKSSGTGASGYGGLLQKNMLKDKAKISKYAKTLRNLASQKYGKLSRQEESDEVRQERYAILKSMLEEADFTDTKKKMIMWNLANEHKKADDRSYNKAFTFVAQYLNSEIMDFGKRYNPRKNVAGDVISYPRVQRKKMERYLEATKMFTYAKGGMAEDPHFKDHFRASVTTLRQMGERDLVDSVLEKYDIQVKE